MQIIPEIFILDGICVALYKGSLEQKDVYSRSPLDFAREFANAGATNMMIIDLDMSEFGSDRNKKIIKEIRNTVDLNIILAGGIRTIDAIYEAFNIGMNKVVLGVSAESIYSQAIDTYGSDRIIAGIKAKGDEVLTDLERDFPLRVIDLAEKMPSLGITKVLYKDMWKESTQIGPNYDEVDRVLRMTPLKVYAGGGIGKTKHLKLLKEIGTSAALIGKAFYEKQLNLSECIHEFQ